MARQTQFQSYTEPIKFTADPPPAVPDLAASIYPDFFQKKRPNWSYFTQPVMVIPDTPVEDGHGGGGFFPRRVTQYQILAEPILVEIPNHVPPSFPDFIAGKRDYNLDYIAEPIEVPFIPVIVPDFVPNVDSFFPRRKTRTDLDYKVEPIFFSDIPLVQALYPDQFFRRRDYSDYQSVFQLLRRLPSNPGDMKKSIIEFFNLVIRLDVKEITDSGSGIADSTDVSGTVFLFNKPFKDVGSVVATVKETQEFIVVVDFVDIPNPTQFKVYVFDTSGVRVTKTIYWVARGIG